MTNETDLEVRAVLALERIAAALEALAGQPQPAADPGEQIGRLVVRPGEVIGLRATGARGAYHQVHAAVYLGGGQFEVQCAARVNTTFDLSAAQRLNEVHIGARCGSPGCAKHYAGVPTR